MSSRERLVGGLIVVGLVLIGLGAVVEPHPGENPRGVMFRASEEAPNDTDSIVAYSSLPPEQQAVVRQAAAEDSQVGSLSVYSDKNPRGHVEYQGTYYWFYTVSLGGGMGDIFSAASFMLFAAPGIGLFTLAMWLRRTGASRPSVRSVFGALGVAVFAFLIGVWSLGFMNW